MKKKLLKFTLLVALMLCSLISVVAADNAKGRCSGVKLKPTILKYDSRNLMALLQYEGLVVIDGTPALDKDIIAKLDVERIKEIKVLPTSKAIAVFGDRAKLGTVLVSLYGDDEEIPADREALPLGDDNAPLFLLDGKPIVQQFLTLIDPNTIAKIEVLKDKSATEMYGEKGKNGVVVVTLKKKKE